MLKNQKGFTLIEIMIVIITLCIVSSFAVPNLLNSVENSKKSTDISNAKVIFNAAKQVLSKHEEIVFDVEVLIQLTDTELNNKDSNQAFKKALLEELKNDLPKPRYKGKTVGKVTCFVLKIGQEGNVTVLTGSDNLDFSSIEVAPNADTVYRPKL